MPTVPRPSRSLTTVTGTFEAAAVTIGTVYLTTHSVTVTVVGAVTATATSAWAAWLDHRRDHDGTASGDPAIASDQHPDVPAARSGPGAGQA